MYFIIGIVDKILLKKFNYVFVFICFLILSFCSFSCAQKANNFDELLHDLYSHTVPTISAQELAKKLQAPQGTYLLFDVRSQKEYQVSHLPQAVLWVYERLGEDLVKMLPKDKKKPIFLYCTVGYRSERAGELLIALGYENVFHLYGGIFSWVNEHFSIQNPSGKATNQVHTYSQDWGKWLQNGQKVYE